MDSNFEFLEENLSTDYLALPEQVSHDLKKYLSNYNEMSKGLRVASQKMGIHQKTLLRLISLKNKPGYLTLMKIYRVVLGTQDDLELLEKCPEPVRKYIESRMPSRMSSRGFYIPSIQSEIIRDRAFCELYFRAHIAPVSRESIHENFGNYGIDTLDKMLRIGVLVETSPGLYTIGSTQTILEAETLKAAGIHLAESYYKPEFSDERGMNFIGLYAEGLSEETYQKWLDIDERAYHEKIEISRQAQAKGKIQAFTFMTTDTLTPRKRGQ